MDFLLQLVLALLSPVVQQIEWPQGNYIVRSLTDMRRSYKNCYSVDRDWNDQELGHFTRQCPRNYESVCCVPERPDEIQVNFILRLAGSKRDDFIKMGSQQSRSLLRHSKHVVVFIHGWVNDYRIEPYINRTRDGWLHRGADVITVDWSRGNKLYEASAANSRIVGALTGQLVDFLGITRQTTCVGFSHGAHACGATGAWIKKRTKQSIPRCHGIDPAGPLFKQNLLRHRLDKNDCDVVVVTHSSAFNLRTGPGISERCGNCDIWINDAHEQPDCPKMLDTAEFLEAISTLQADKLLLATEYYFFCSHIRGILYYNEQLWNTSTSLATPCSRTSKRSSDCSIRTSRKTMHLPPDDHCTRWNNEVLYAYSV